MSDEKVVYRIRRKSDGKFSTGSVNPRFNSCGKSWTRLSNLNNHLTLVHDGLEYPKKNGLTVYADCEIVGYRESFTKPIGGQV